VHRRYQKRAGPFVARRVDMMKWDGRDQIEFQGSKADTCHYLVELGDGRLVFKFSTQAGSGSHLQSYLKLGSRFFANLCTLKRPPQSPHPSYLPSLDSPDPHPHLAPFMHHLITQLIQTDLSPNTFPPLRVLLTRVLEYSIGLSERPLSFGRMKRG